MKTASSYWYRGEDGLVVVTDKFADGIRCLVILSDWSPFATSVSHPEHAVSWILSCYIFMLTLVDIACFHSVSSNFFKKYDRTYTAEDCRLQSYPGSELVLYGLQRWIFLPLNSAVIAL